MGAPAPSVAHPETRTQIGVPPINLLYVFLLSLLTAAATGVGALPFLWVKKPGRRWLGYGNAAAAGLMLAASGQLVFEGWQQSPERLGAGLAAGLVFIAATRWFLGRFDEVSVGALRAVRMRAGPCSSSA